MWLLDDKGSVYIVIVIIVCCSSNNCAQKLHLFSVLTSKQ